MCAHGHARADFPGPLGDTDQHDVHDANPSDHQRHAGDGKEQSRHHISGSGGCRGDFFLGPDREIVVSTRANVMTLPRK